jgi:putative transcriptional regulator
MRKVADSIRRGLEQAVAYAKREADLRAYRVHMPPASAGAGSAGSTRAYLLVIDRAPRAVEKALRAA